MNAPIVVSMVSILLSAIVAVAGWGLSSLLKTLSKLNDTLDSINLRLTIVELKTGIPTVPAKDLPHT